MKAIASGNPAVLTLAEADAELQRLALLKKNHLDEQYVARRRVRDLPDIITSQTERLAKLTEEEATTKAHAYDPVAVGGKTSPSKDLPEVLGTRLDAVLWTVSERTRFPLCHPDRLERLFIDSGLTKVTGRTLEVPTVFAEFDDYWEPFLGGQGPAPTYCASLSAQALDRLRDRLRSTLSTEPDGSIT